MALPIFMIDNEPMTDVLKLTGIKSKREARRTWTSNSAGIKTTGEK